MEPRELQNFVSLRVEAIRSLKEIAQEIDPRMDDNVHKRILVLAGSFANEITPYQKIARDLFDNNSSNQEIPHIMNSVLSVFKNYMGKREDTDVIKPVWKSWKTTMKEA